MDSPSNQEKNEDLITFFIADDHSIFRDDLKALIARDERYLLVGEADEGMLAWLKIAESKPEIALLDINMPLRNGLEVAALIQESKLETKIVIVTSYKDECLVNSAIEIGVVGYVLKDDYVSDLPDALQAASVGERFISPSLLAIVQKRDGHVEYPKSKSKGLDGLTPSQLRVLRLIAEGRNHGEIAIRLAMSTESVGSHRRSIGDRLQLQSSCELMSFAHEHLDELKGFKLIPQDFE
ncbi:response regulator transcription factor [Verrucomicrobia bacterium]|nr:response regulator transcription factor [Verrucomicrobiota bacterium]